MNGWQRWLKAPATHFLHKVLFQLHLWLGIGCGLYILLISVSGSAVVLRPHMARWFVDSQVPHVLELELHGAALETSIARAYPGFEVIRVVPARQQGAAVYVQLAGAGLEQSRYFDQYQGQDLGSTFPWQMQTVEWLTRFHDDLLLGNMGQQLNGIGGLVLLSMVFSGLLIWWQGSKRWHQGLLISRTNSRSLLWQLHSFAGFWSLLLLLVWGVTAVYFAWPAPFEAVVDQLDKNPDDYERPDGWIRTLVVLHFGRFRGQLWLSWVWIVLGLLPAVMYISGFILWYRRVLKPGPSKQLGR